MLTSIYCEKLTKKELIFENGLNVLVGANNGENSIGKSSVLMLIDFSFGGNSFPNDCSDVISCLLYTSDAADDLTRVALGG
ncbi:hypothetical protein CTM96_07995, partial [Photobacterium phosphoreum]